MCIGVVWFGGRWADWDCLYRDLLVCVDFFCDRSVILSHFEYIYRLIKCFLFINDLAICSTQMDTDVEISLKRQSNHKFYKNIFFDSKLCQSDTVQTKRRLYIFFYINFFL